MNLQEAQLHSPGLGAHMLASNPLLPMLRPVYNVPRRVEHLQSTIVVAASLVHRSVLLSKDKSFVGSTLHILVGEQD